VVVIITPRSEDITTNPLVGVTALVFDVLLCNLFGRPVVLVLLEDRVSLTCLCRRIISTSSRWVLVLYNTRIGKDVLPVPSTKIVNVSALISFESGLDDG
jgi:hypothetical protein